MTNSEKYKFRTPKQFALLSLRLTPEMMEWLAESTEDNEGRKISNNVLFQDLLARLHTEASIDNSFRRPIRLPAGWFQFSELRLSEEWSMGRKKIHYLLQRLDARDATYVVFDTIHSAMTFPCVVGRMTHNCKGVSLKAVGQYVDDDVP